MVRRYLVLAVLLLTVGLAAGIFSERQHVPGAVLASVTRLLPGRSNTATVAPVVIESVIPPTLQGHLSLIVLAGQSNMSGTAPVPNPAPTDPRVYVFGNDYRWKIATEPIDSAAGQVDPVSIDPDAGSGPALPFATALLKSKPDMIIGLIPCSLSGSTISEWQRQLADNTLYGSCLKRARAASPLGRIAGVLFFQGEGDARDPSILPDHQSSPDRWAALFTQFVSDWRNDTNSPTLPFVFAQIGSTTQPSQYPNWNLVKQQQSSVKLPNVTMITTDDLPTVNVAHFDANGYTTIGERFAAAYLTTQTRP